MDAGILREYRARWRSVNEREAAEMRAASMASRWRELNAAYGLARSLGIEPEANVGSESIQRRWMRLKGLSL
jgi:hypothetical protein